MDLTGAILSGATLCRADLSYATLYDADLRYADLSGADLSSAELGGADFTSADLEDANLENADLEKAILNEADLTGANLNGANLKQVSGLTQQQIDVAQGNSGTVLPDGLRRPRHWPMAEPREISSRSDEIQLSDEVQLELHRARPETILQALELEAYGEIGNDVAGSATEVIRRRIADRPDELRKHADYLIDDLQCWIGRLQSETPNEAEDHKLHTERIGLLQRSIAMLQGFSSLLTTAGPSGNIEPDEGAPVSGIAEQSEGLFRSYLSEFESWLRDNRAAVVDKVFKGSGLAIGLGGVFAFLSAVGFPVVAAAPAAAMVVFGGSISAKRLSRVFGLRRPDEPAETKEDAS